MLAGLIGDLTSSKNAFIDFINISFYKLAGKKAAHESTVEVSLFGDRYNCDRRLSVFFCILPKTIQKYRNL